MLNQFSREANPIPDVPHESAQVPSDRSKIVVFIIREGDEGWICQLFWYQWELNRCYNSNLLLIFQGQLLVNLQISNIII